MAPEARPSTTCPSRRPSTRRRTRGPVGAELDRLHDVPVELAVEIGRTPMTIGEALALGPGSIVTLNRLAGEPVDLLVNGRPIARGEVVVIDEEFGLRITEVCPAARRAAAAARRPPDAPALPRTLRPPSGWTERLRTDHPHVAPAGPRELLAQGLQDGITGLAGMVAYSMLLSIFPLGLIALFVAGRVLSSEDVEASVVNDLQRIFPPPRASTLRRRSRRVRESSTTVGIVALARRCRGLARSGARWTRRSAASTASSAAPGCARSSSRSGCCVVVLLFIAGTVAVPTLQGIAAHATPPRTSRSGSPTCAGSCTA